LFLHDRAFDDCLDRLGGISRTYDRALLVGCPSPAWPERLNAFARHVDVADPGKLFARQAGGDQVEEDRHDFGEDRYDLCIAIGTLDTVNDLPVALRLIRRALRHRRAESWERWQAATVWRTLRACLVEAGRKNGRVAARTHPRIEAPSLAQLLSATGYSMPVVDVDRVKVRYAALAIWSGI
jgi:hypothetical protein